MERIRDEVVRYTKVRLTSDLAEAVTFVAAECRVPRQRLLEGILAQVLVVISPTVAKWERLQVSTGLLGVPQIEVKVLKEKEITPRSSIHDEDVEYARRIRREAGEWE